MLAKKVASLYELMQKQLSQASHYDFKLRAIISALKFCGQLRRESKTKQAQMKRNVNKDFQDEEKGPEKETEEQIVMRGIRGMNLPKLMKEDIPLFEGLFQDLFPGVELVENANQDSVPVSQEAARPPCRFSLLTPTGNETESISSGTECPREACIPREVRRLSLRAPHT